MQRTIDKRNEMRLLPLCACNVGHQSHELKNNRGSVVAKGLQAVTFEDPHVATFDGDSYLWWQPVGLGPDLLVRRILI